MLKASRNDKEIESIGLEIKRLSAELEVTKLEGKRDVGKIAALTKDWKRACKKSATLAADVAIKRARIVELEVERDRDIRRSSRIARRDIA